MPKSQRHNRFARSAVTDLPKPSLRVRAEASCTHISLPYVVGVFVNIPGEAEVTDLDHVVLGQEDVPGCQIPMDALPGKDTGSQGAGQGVPALAGGRRASLGMGKEMNCAGSRSENEWESAPNTLGYAKEGITEGTNQHYSQFSNFSV